MWRWVGLTLVFILLAKPVTSAADIRILPLLDLATSQVPQNHQSP